MHIQQLISSECALCNLAAFSKKKLLSIIADKVHELNPSIDSQTIYNALLGREKLGSTGIGDQVAIPHCRIPGSTETIALLITLDRGIEYESPDGKPVTLVFALLAPEEADDEHLNLLNEIATLLHVRANRERIAAAESNNELFSAFQTLNEDLSERA